MDSVRNHKVNMTSGNPYPVTDTKQPSRRVPVAMLVDVTATRARNTDTPVGQQDINSGFWCSNTGGWNP